VYFYLCGEEGSGWGMKVCWVRNRVQAPSDLDVESMKSGAPPVLPHAFCQHPHGAAALDQSQLRVVWFEEGDGAALLEGDQILAVIPAWSGEGGFHGYARDCVGESTVCWGLKQATKIIERVRESERYWKAWDDANLWPEYQRASLAAVEQAVGKSSNYYGIDNKRWPPKAMVRIPRADGVALITIGVGLRAQPMVEQYHENPRPHRRIELAAGIRAPGESDEAIMAIGQYISGQSGYPWARFSWLGDFHTLACDSWPDKRFPAVALLKAFPSAPAAIQLPAFRGDPVNVLWMIGITDAEWKFAQQESTQRLVEMLVRKGVGWAFESRKSVV